MLKTKGFDNLIASDVDYERLVCEIYYDGNFFGLISQELKAGSFDFETASANPKVNVEELKIAIETACKRLSGEVK